jgi:hypothetical protein
MSTKYDASSVGSVFERFMSERTPRPKFTWTFDDAERKRKLEDWKRIDTPLCIWTYGAYTNIKTLQKELNRWGSAVDPKRTEKKAALAKAVEEHKRLSEESMQKWKIFWFSNRDHEAGTLNTATINWEKVQIFHRLREIHAARNVPVKTYKDWRDEYWMTKD